MKFLARRTEMNTLRADKISSPWCILFYGTIDLANDKILSSLAFPIWVQSKNIFKRRIFLLIDSSKVVNNAIRDRFWNEFPTFRETNVIDNFMHNVRANDGHSFSILSIDLKVKSTSTALNFRILPVEIHIARKVITTTCII